MQNNLNFIVIYKILLVSFNNVILKKTIDCLQEYNPSRIHLYTPLYFDIFSIMQHFLLYVFGKNYFSNYMEK